MCIETRGAEPQVHRAGGRSGDYEPCHFKFLNIISSEKTSLTNQLNIDPN